jgi:hypothetical protein
MKKITTILVIVSLVIVSGCKKYIDNDNLSPNQPATATPASYLGYSSLALISNYNGELARISSILVQHSQGTLEQYVGISEYAILEGDMNNSWDKLWIDGMTNAKQLEKAAGSENPYYQGIAKIHQAMLFGLATDLWGDVPFTEAGRAFEGEEFYYPSYDSQQSILAGIQTLLNDGITLLQSAPEDNILFPGGEDLIHGGDPSLWIKTAYVLKARYYNRLSKIDPVGSATNALAALTAAGMTDADDANGHFGTNPNEYNQWYAFCYVERGNYMKMGKTLIDLLVATSDPRLPFIASEDDNAGYSGTDPADFDISTSNIGSYYASPDADCPLVTYVESKFLEAECKFRTGDLDGAATAYNDAVIAHVTKVTGGPDAVYFAAFANENAGTISLSKIMTQKWISSVTQIEAWADWRRTDLPALTPSSASTLGAIPRRLPTPTDERVNNPNAIAIQDLLNRVYWDVP